MAVSVGDYLMEPVVEAFIISLTTFLTASIGFWVNLKKRIKLSDNERRLYRGLLMGLAQNTVLYLGMKYIERGWVSKDEYDDLRRYLYEPYHELGGNGTVERIMHAVERLPLEGERAQTMMVETFRDISIRADDPTGVPETRAEPYTGPERRKHHDR